ncbi:MAG: hypothetical protein AAF891_09020 [Pseudomonadota bacterium]
MRAQCGIFRARAPSTQVVMRRDQIRVTGMDQDRVDKDLPVAAQYVSGTLDAAEGRAFEKQMQADDALKAEVLRWRAFYAEQDAGEHEGAETVIGHLKRELWDENKLPWHRRMRIWEFALGGAAAALLAYAVAYFQQ